MKKLIYTPILITIVLFCLQGLWLNKIHHAYMKQSMQTIQQKNDTVIGDYSCGSGCDKCDYLGERLERK